MFLFLPIADSWSEWSEWSECDSSGMQLRVRQCILLFPVGSQCTGNTTESRACAFDSNFIPGEISALLERLMKSLSISRTKRNTVLTQNFVEEKNLPVFIQRVQVYSVELMLLNLVSS